MTRAERIEKAARAVLGLNGKGQCYCEGPECGPCSERMDALRAALAPESGTPEPKKCACHWEVGDSPCPVHGEDEPEPTPEPKRPVIRNLTRPPPSSDAMGRGEGEAP